MKARIAALVAAVAAAAGTAGAAAWARGRKDDEELDLEVAAAAPDSSGAGSTTAAPSDGLDDLTVIKGLGKVKAAKLVAAGVTSYSQIAAWTDDDIARFGLEVNTSPGQIKREDWVGQAQTLAEG